MASRVAQMIHHIITLCDPQDLGATKLAKALWFSDVEHFRKTGSTITRADSYKKNEQGPLHADFYSAIDMLVREGKIVTSMNPTPVGARREYIAHVLPDLNCFTAEEIATIDRVVARISPRSAKAISEETHDALWEEARWNEVIPVAAASVVLGNITSEIEAWAIMALGKDEYSATA